jgi:hypothetical protein
VVPCVLARLGEPGEGVALVHGARRRGWRSRSRSIAAGGEAALLSSGSLARSRLWRLDRCCLV